MMSPHAPLRLAGLLLLFMVATSAQAQQEFGNVDRNIDKTFQLNRVVTGPGGDEYRVRGDLHVVLHTELDRGDYAMIKGAVTPQGVTVERVSGSRSYRVVGSTPVNHRVERPRERAANLSQRFAYGLASQGDAPNLGLVIHLDGHLTRDGGLVVRVDDIRLHERNDRNDRSVDRSVDSVDRSVDSVDRSDDSVDRSNARREARRDNRRDDRRDDSQDVRRDDRRDW